jgi:hypothetical protein
MMNFFAILFSGCSAMNILDFLSDVYYIDVTR